MPEGLLSILKLCLLALLYLFFLRVVRAVWVELDGPRLRLPGSAKAAKVARTPAKPAGRASRRGGGSGPRLVIVAPDPQRGTTYSLDADATLGRAATCDITLQDTYMSQHHARVFRLDGQLYVEDLGSTNGTYLNRAKVVGRMLLRPGDQVQVGSTILELA